MENLAGRCPAAQRPPSVDNPQPADGDAFEALGVRPVGCTGVAALPPSPWEIRSAVALSPAASSVAIGLPGLRPLGSPCRGRPIRRSARLLARGGAVLRARRTGRSGAVVGDRGRSAPRAGWLFAVDSDQVLRITVLAFAPVAGAQGGGALWARAAGRAGGGGCGLRSGSALRRFRSPPGTPVMIRSQHPATNRDPTRQNDLGTAVGRGPGRQRRRMFHLQ
jgi:hypothetical protein